MSRSVEGSYSVVILPTSTNPVGVNVEVKQM